MTVFLTHNRVKLALHTLRNRPGPSLLLLHALGDHAPTETPLEFASWPGAVLFQRGISAACCASNPKSIIEVSTCRLTWT